jgi:hypothetical protein
MCWRRRRRWLLWAEVKAGISRGGGGGCLGLALPAHWSRVLAREARGGEDQHGDVVSPGLAPGLFLVRIGREQGGHPDELADQALARGL